MTGLQTTFTLTLCVHIKPFKGFSLRQMNEKKNSANIQGNKQQAKHVFE